jgi:hypothetical protein
VEQLEKNSRQLVSLSSDLTKEQFAGVLHENSLKILDDWKQLSARLLLKFHSNAGIKYEKKPQPDTPKNY